MQLKAYAKLNLQLHLNPNKTKNGLYPVSFLNTQINLSDKIEIKKTKTNKIKIKYLNYPIKPQECIISKTIKLLQKKFPNKATGLNIKIKKNIPVRAGLGGGSADAGAVLKYLNKTWKLNLSNTKLVQLANQIGKDVCYAVIGRLCKVEGTGEMIKPLQAKLPKFHLLIVAPNIKKPSTKWCYKNLDPKKLSPQITNNKLQITNFHNDFEPLIFSKFPQIKNIKQQLLDLGANNAILAGSGLSVVGFFKTKKQAQLASKKFKNYQTFILHTL